MGRHDRGQPRWRFGEAVELWCLRRRCVGGARADEAGSASLELVLLAPVLMLLVLLVLWAGRAGRAGLIVDLAAEEAAVAAAVGCDNTVGTGGDGGSGGEADLADDNGGSAGDSGGGGGSGCESLVMDVLLARPGLGLLCIGGPRPGWSEGFVRRERAAFGAGSEAAGVVVLVVRLECETDGALAPLRGVLPTVRFRGEASEVVVLQGLG